jgi:copper homeostasis protein
MESAASSLGSRARPLIEICCDSLTSARAAQQGGADRVELCGPLDTGGTTPSAGLIEAVCQAVSIPVHVLIRARSGDFCYSADELQVMAADVTQAGRLGAAGVVIGALDPNGRADRDGLARLLDAAGPLSVTFHRAIDVAADPLAVVDELIELGIARVLTSGGKPTAPAGAETIAALVCRAAEKLIILAGSGVSAENAATLVTATGVAELHVGSAVRRAFAGNAATAGEFGTRPAEVAVDLVADLMRRWQ